MTEQNLNIRQLAKKYVLEYLQGNPFNVGDKFTKFNIAYYEELKKHFIDKPQSYYSEYYQEVSRREKANGQIIMQDMEV